MRLRALSVLVMAPMLVAACAAEQVSGPSPAAGAAVDSPTGAGPESRIGNLPRQPLVAGGCGLFIWARGDRDRLILHSDSQAPAARMRIDGREVLLHRTAAEGGQGFESFNRLTYEGSGLSAYLNMKVERRPDVIGGAVIPEGVIRLTFEDGAAFVMPVSGLIACRGPEEEGRKAR